MSKKMKINLDNPYIKEGVFRRNERGFGFVNIQERTEEIFIPATKSMHALDGDTVLIKIKKQEHDGQKREGEIIEIKHHSRSLIVGTFQRGKNFGFVIPDDKKVSDDIFIEKKNLKNIKNLQKVEVKITKYPDKNHKPEGEITEIIGGIDENGVDILSLVKEYRLPYEFPLKVMKDAKKIDQQISEQEIKTRLDLRKEEIYTIDGEDAKDLDDAVQVKKNKDGTYILGVHIADVSHYVKAGSELDKEARLRGTSIYLMDRVIPMLPAELSNGICSLNAGVDRLALSVIMTIDKNGKVIDSEIQKSVIRVTKRMSYHEVQNILASPKGDSHFERMRELKDILKKRRDKQGSLNLEIPESKITLDKNGVAINVEKYDYNEANEIIEQFMLTANETVAEKFYWLQAPFIYRVHEVPDIDKVNELNQFLFSLGYKIKGVKKDDEESIHPKAFAEVLEKVKGEPEERVVSHLILRTLKVARYEKQNKGHFGIASKCYCHFTSPIRRYPDLFIHRVITEYLKKNYQIDDNMNNQFEVQSAKYAELASEREKIAQKVERDAEDIKKAEYMQNKIGEQYEGVVSNVTPFGMFVELENTVEGLVRFENMGTEYFWYDEERKLLKGEHTKRTFKIGDIVKIQVIEADKITRKIDFALIES